MAFFTEEMQRLGDFLVSFHWLSHISLVVVPSTNTTVKKSGKA
jgi:hypothetical protein